MNEPGHEEPDTEMMSEGHTESTSADFIRASADVGFPTLTPRVHDITSGVIRGAIGWEPVSAGAYLAGAA